LDDLRGLVSIRAFAPEILDWGSFELFLEAARARKAVRAEYKKPTDKVHAPRHVQPLHMVYYDYVWYVISQDVKDGQTKTFMVSRFQNGEKTSMEFRRPKDFTLDGYLGNAFGIMKGDGDYEVFVEFDEWATDYIKRRKWHKTAEFTELPNGAGSRLRMRLSGLLEVERFIMSWGLHATVAGQFAWSLRRRSKRFTGKRPPWSMWMRRLSSRHHSRSFRRKHERGRAICCGRAQGRVSNGADGQL
jgi:predicted DNA-binding transcriptional regulator YafY